MNITTIENGFELNDSIFLFEQKHEILSDSQVHIDTDNGTILLDLSCTINGILFTDIDLFIQSLKGE